MIALGHARTRGYGRVSVSLGEPEGPGPGSEAWESWSRDLLGYIGRSGSGEVPHDPSSTFAFALSLPTGAVLVDDLLRSTNDIADAVDWLPRLPDPDDPRRTLGREPTILGEGRLFSLGAEAEQDRLRGWNAAHGLPRQDEWAVARGSVFAYWFEGPSGSRSTLLERLGGLAREGVGLRRGEGFGVVTVSDEFHRTYHRQERERPTR